MKAFKKARKGKSKRDYIKEFEASLNEELMKLKFELETLTYYPKPLKRLIVRDPKTRVIYASHFRDRVIHHALFNITEPIFEKIFIYDSYANRKKKGTHLALKRFDYFKRKVTKNGKLVRYAKDDNMVVGYVLKADIKHYFDTVDHEVLINIIKKKIKDEKVIWLIKRILENHDFKIFGKGMPIGNLTSQFFANVYLNKLDYFVKHKLKVKYYIRYVDDFVILHPSKSQLKIWKNEINTFLKSELKIELHKQKSRVIPLLRGIDFVGFRNFYYYKLLRKRNVRKMLSRIKQYRNSRISHNKIFEIYQDWKAYAKWANTFKLRRRILEDIMN